MLAGWRLVELEHRLQLLFDLQTHRVPEDSEARGRLARGLGFEAAAGRSAGESMLSELESRRRPTRLILEHLLHQSVAAGDDPAPVRFPISGFWLGSMTRRSVEFGGAAGDAPAASR